MPQLTRASRKMKKPAGDGVRARPMSPPPSGGGDHEHSAYSFSATPTTQSICHTNPITKAGPRKTVTAARRVSSTFIRLGLALARALFPATFVPPSVYWTRNSALTAAPTEPKPEPPNAGTAPPDGIHNMRGGFRMVLIDPLHRKAISLPERVNLVHSDSESSSSFDCSNDDSEDEGEHEVTTSVTSVSISGSSCSSCSSAPPTPTISAGPYVNPLLWQGDSDSEDEDEEDRESEDDEDREVEEAVRDRGDEDEDEDEEDEEFNADADAFFGDDLDDEALAAFGFGPLFIPHASSAPMTPPSTSRSSSTKTPLNMARCASPDPSPFHSEQLMDTDPDEEDADEGSPKASSGRPFLAPAGICAVRLAWSFAGSLPQDDTVFPIMPRIGPRIELTPAPATC